MKTYKEDIDKYEHLKRKKLMNAKENKTIELLNSFRERLFNAKSNVDEEKEAEPNTSNDLDRILAHKLDVDEDIHQKVIDANVQELDRYDIYDPRNTLNKRKRDISKEVMKSRKKH